MTFSPVAEVITHVFARVMRAHFVGIAKLTGRIVNFLIFCSEIIVLVAQCNYIEFERKRLTSCRVVIIIIELQSRSTVISSAVPLKIVAALA